MRGRLDRLVLENAAYLDQLHAFVRDTAVDAYREARPPFARGGIGKHVRHVLEFYHILLCAQDRIVDYDTRCREAEIETDPRKAAERAIELKQMLHDLHDRANETLTVVSTDEHGTLRVASTLERELVFLASHTVHHMAIIRMIGELLGRAVADRFGVAPSTLQHEARAG